mmetsp:Transcript_2899/g.4189  ORF Transcript_2899/g.4189 Transcript_2899/m.4189 type:complete len:319 (+) Transcript_2899:55-1011(+)
MNKIQILSFLAVCALLLMISFYMKSRSENSLDSRVAALSEKFSLIHQRLEEINKNNDDRANDIMGTLNQFSKVNRKVDEKVVDNINEKLNKLLSSEDLEEVEEKDKKVDANGRQYLLDPEGRTVDFVISVRFIHCSVKYSVVKINEYFNPKRIIFLSYSKEHCTVLRGFATNVHCIWEQDILPHFTPSRFAKLVDEEVKKTNDKTIVTAKKNLPSHIGSFKDRAGWFFLQMINLGVARHMTGLSENYIVWDSDIIPLTPNMKFWNDKGQIIRYTQRSHGELIANAYHKSYELLTGKTIIHPNGREIHGFRDEETWVAH